MRYLFIIISVGLLISCSKKKGAALLEGHYFGTITNAAGTFIEDSTYVTAHAMEDPDNGHHVEFNGPIFSYLKVKVRPTPNAVNSVSSDETELTYNRTTTELNFTFTWVNGERISFEGSKL